MPPKKKKAPLLGVVVISEVRKVISNSRNVLEVITSVRIGDNRYVASNHVGDEAVAHKGAVEIVMQNHVAAIVSEMSRKHLQDLVQPVRERVPTK